MTVIPAGAAQANFLFTGAAAPTGAECTLGIDLPGSPPGVETVAEILYTAWADLFLPLQSDQIVLAGVLVKYGPSDTGPSALFTGSSQGTITDDGISPNVAYLVQKNTALGGRAGRGRMYVPGGIDEEVGVSGGLDAGVVSDWNTALETFIDNLTFVSLPPVLLHGVGSPISTPTVITSMVMQGTAATQRRRLRR